MFKYVLALLCGTSITGSVYMAGWGSQPCSESAKGGSAMECTDCCTPGSSGSETLSTAVGIDVGNTKCIVMGEDVGASKLVVDYQGKIYHICCGDCTADFKKDPEKWVKALEADPAKFGVKKAN